MYFLYKNILSLNKIAAGCGKRTDTGHSAAGGLRLRRLHRNGFDRPCRCGLIALKNVPELSYIEGIAVIALEAHDLRFIIPSNHINRGILFCGILLEDTSVLRSDFRRLFRLFGKIKFEKDHFFCQLFKFLFLRQYISPLYQTRSGYRC